MKCHKCQADSNLQDRSNGRCSRCSHPFVFDPRRTNDPYNDIQFSKALEAISPANSIKFSPRQFYYFLNSRKFAGTSLTGCTIIGLFPVFLLIFIFTTAANKGANVFFTFMWLLFAYFILVLIAKFKQEQDEAKHRFRWTYNRIKDDLSRWENHNGLIGGLLPEPSKSIPAVADVPKEILDYSFDRLVVTQHDEIAQFLIANNFHFENNCAVLSINKYPYTLFDTVMTMLRNNENLKVYALHDCSWDGISMLDKLRSEDAWFGKQASAQIIDLGLVPRQMEKRKTFIERTSPHEDRPISSVSDKLRRSLNAKETQWLSTGKVVRLESIAPRTLLRLITMGIAASRDPEKKDALIPIDTRNDGLGDGGIYVFSGDSFG